MLAFLVLSLLHTYVSAMACNGYPEYCNKQYNEMTHIVNHNAYAYVPNPAANQLCPVTTQLTDGVRGLKLSAIRAANATSAGTSADSIMLCHTSCSIYNGGPAVDTLKNITQWLNDNPNEVVTIMWNNLGSFKPAAFKAAYDAANLTNYCYSQPLNNYTWPTLGELISSGKRLINFMDEGSNVGNLEWLLPEWSFVFETPYNNQNESSFSCVIDRPIEVYSPTEYMYVMNHFVYGMIPLGSLDIEIPQMGSANTTNSKASLLKQAKNCTATFGRQPNFLELDFYNLGDSLEIAATLNNVTYTPAEQLQCNIYAAEHKVPSTTSIAATQFRIMYGSTVLLSLVAITFIALF